MPDSLPARCLRVAATGYVVGATATLLTQFVLPLFFDSLLQLQLLPGLAALVGGIVGAFLARPVQVRGLRRLTALGLAILLPMLLFAAHSGQREWKVSPQILMVALDGTSWNVLDPLVDAGELPTIADFKDNGTSGTLTSFEPTYSPIIWTSIATGQPPSVHGISSFYPSQEQLRSKRIWDVLADQGRTVGVFRWWVTWPPRPVPGFMVPGLLARDPSTVPQEVEFVNRLRLQSKAGADIGLLQMLDYGWRYLRVGMSLSISREIVLELVRARQSRDPVFFHVAQRRAEVRLNATVFGYLMRRDDPDFAAFYDNGIDVLAHSYWRFYEPALFEDIDPADVERYGSLLPDYVRLVDRVVGELRTHLSEQSTTLLLSDHGVKAGPESSVTRLNPRTETILDDLGTGSDYDSVNLAARNTIESIKVDDVARSHRLEGVVMAQGPGIRAGTTIEGASVMDIAPTVLYASGAPVADDLSGKILSELFSAEFLASHPVRRVPSYGGLEGSESDLKTYDETTETLRSTGYLD